MYNDGNNISRNIVILSDTKSVLQALTNNQLNVCHNRFITEIKRIQYKLKRELNKRIVFIWISAHVFKANEIVNRLAKEVTKK